MNYCREKVAALHDEAAADKTKALYLLTADWLEMDERFGLLEWSHREVCNPLQEICQRQHLGLGGENVAVLVVAALEAAQATIAGQLQTVAAAQSEAHQAREATQSVESYAQDLRRELEAAQKALIEIGTDVARANKVRAQAIRATNEMGTRLRAAEAENELLKQTLAAMDEQRVKMGDAHRHTCDNAEVIMDEVRRLTAALETVRRERDVAQSNAEAISKVLIDQGDRHVEDLAKCRLAALEEAVLTVYHLPMGATGARTAQDAVVALRALIDKEERR